MKSGRVPLKDVGVTRVLREASNSSGGLDICSFSWILVPLPVHQVVKHPPWRGWRPRISWFSIMSVFSITCSTATSVLGGFAFPLVHSLSLGAMPLRSRSLRSLIFSMVSLSNFLLPPPPFVLWSEATTGDRAS